MRIELGCTPHCLPPHCLPARLGILGMTAQLMQQRMDKEDYETWQRYMEQQRGATQGHITDHLFARDQEARVRQAENAASPEPYAPLPTQR